MIANSVPFGSVRYILLGQPQKITVKAVDIAGNMASAAVMVEVDTTPPQEFVPNVVLGGSYKDEATINFNTIDLGSGLEKYDLYLNGILIAENAASPYQQKLADGSYLLELVASDKVGNERVGKLEFEVAGIPEVPEGFQGVYENEQIVLTWNDCPDRVATYVITRTPEFSDNTSKRILIREEAENQYIDTDIEADRAYTYLIQAVSAKDVSSDVAEPVTVITGELAVIDEAVMEKKLFDGGYLSIPAGVVAGTEEIVTEISQKPLPGNKFAAKVGNVHSFKLVDKLTQEIVERKFEKPIIATFDFSSLTIPEGYEESDLGIYWYNEIGGYWERVEYYEYNLQNRTIKVKLDHFSEYQMMASKFVSPSLDSYYGMGVSNYQGYFQNNIESVSPLSGSLSVSATDLIIPGRNGGVFAIKRTYDTAGAEQEKIIEANNTSVYQVFYKTPFDMFGNGWYLNVPWIEQNDNGKFIRLPNGQTVKIELNKKNYFEYHEGVHFVLHGTSKLVMNEGTIFEFDKEGRVIRQTDPASKNTLTYKYNGRKLVEIRDGLNPDNQSLNHVVKFTYKTITKSFSKPIEGADGNVEYEKVKYDVNFISEISSGEVAVTFDYDDNNNLIKVSDPMGRETRYTYSKRTYKSGVKATLGGDDTFKYTFWLLNQITYPTQEVSKYTYKEYDMYTEEQKYVVFVRNRVRYSGTKVVVAQHELAGKVTNYSFTMNGKIGSLLKGNFTPAYTYVLESRVKVGDLLSVNYLNQIDGTWLTDLPKDSDNYKGALPVKNITYLGNKLVEKVVCDYDVSLRAVTEQHFYREGIDKEPKYTITTKYDAWGNITQRSDTSLGVVEKFTYEKQNALDEYPKHLMIERKVENRIPKLDSDDYDVQILITTYQYQEGGLKPAAIVFNDGIKEKKTEFTYDAWWNLISQKDYSVKGLDTDEYFETRITYDKSNMFPIKKTVIGIVNANLTEAERVNITTQTEYDYQTGLKLNEIDAKGNVTSYQYDKLNRLIKVTVPTDDGGSLTKAFDFRDAENICIFTNEKQQQTLFKFDGLGRLTEVIKGSNDYQNYEGYYKDPETGIGGLRVRYEYNVYGQIEKEIDGLGNITRYKYDGMNRVTQIIYADDNAVTLSYDDTTNTTTIKNENGNEVSERKDWAGRLVEAKQKYSYTIGNSSAIYHTYFTWENKYDPLGNKLWQKDALGNVVTQKFDSLGNVLEVKLPQINVVKPGETERSPHEPLLIYEYDAAGHKIGEIGANGNLHGLSAEQREKYKTSYKYDQLGRLIKATVQATGNEARYYYDELGNKVREISLDNQGNILSEVTYTYSVRGWLHTAKAVSALTDAAGKPIYRVVSYEYDELGNKTKETDPKGNSILYFYDDLNRLVRTVMPDAAKIEVAYDILGNKIKETDANGVSVSYTYDSRNRVSELRDNRGVVQTRYTYDAAGNLFEVQDAMGKVTRTEYDSLGRAVKVISNPDLAERIEVTTTYDAVGNVVATTDGRGNVYQSEYNAVGWLTKVIDPLKNEVNHQYDPAGNKVKTITPKGLQYVTEYDQLNRVVKEYESSLTTADKYVVYTYDTRGNLATSTDRRGTKFSYTYNVDNSLQRMDAINGTESYYAEYEYDLLGKVLRTSDSKGTSLASTYDKLTQRIMKVTRGFDNASYTTEYSYDKGGLITGIKYPDTSETSGWVEYAYDNLNRLSKVAGFIEEITYQDNGALTSTRYANGAYTTYTYDSNHRLASLNATVKGNDIYTAIYGYDKNSNIVSLTENVEVSKTYRYDVKNQLIQAVTIPKDQKIRETMPTPGQYALTEQDYSGQARASFFGFSEAGAKLLGLDYNSSSIGIQFDASATKIKQLQLVPDYKYKTHRIVERAINIFVSDSGDLYDAVPKNNWSFEKDGAGVVTITFNETISAAYLKVQVKYDDFNVNFTPKIDQATFLNELAKMLHVYQEGSSIKENYTYDGDGNRILEEITIVHTSKNESKYEENTNRLLENAKFTFEYDDNGNLITKRSKLTNEVWYYTYDLLNHLTRVTNREGVVLSEYNYDVTGLRVVKVAKGVKTHYIFEGTEVIYEKNITKATSKSYIYALGKHLARVDGVVGDETAKKYFYHTDHLGSIKAVTDQEGQVVFRADYFSFGKQYSKETNGDFDEAHGFTGKEYDADIDLSYFNARWYDADLGRFISEDPARDPNNPNFYSYCANNPMVYVDPTGEYFWWAVAIGAAIGGASNYSDGGSFLAGAALGAVSGAISAGIGSGVGALGLNSTMTLMLSSTISGGITSVVFGGSLSDGLKAGAISGAVAGVVRFACLKSAITNPGVISAFTGAAGAAISDGDPLEAAVTGFISGAITAGVANRQAQQRAARIMSLQEQPATNSHYDLPEECNDVILNKSYFIDAVLDDYSNRIMSNVAASFDATYEEGIGQLNVLTEAFMQTRSVNNTSPEEIIVKTARGFMAAIIPYGHSPRPFDNDNADGKMDCSELTYRAYKKAGRNIPTTAVTQYEFFKKNHLIFEDSKALPKIGDILFMATDTNRPKVVTHVAIVVSVENDG